ncbi:MAG: alkaline phosphatase D family protein [Betaproteobacteria bacterium]
MPDRRRFLQALATLGALRVSLVSAQPRFAIDPFGLGVASGYPQPDGMVLWTRLVGDLAPAAIPVRWEIAADESMRSIVAKGTADAHPAWAHSVHVEPRGLDPDRWYWYRFHAGDATSPVGRTRTAPGAGVPATRLRFAFASCQQYEQGYFGAYRHIAADAPDLVAFLGDYIYESSWGRDHVRKHGAPAPRTLNEYRTRYALYKSDLDLQASHAASPWIATWDDHEVVNDYAAGHAGSDSSRNSFAARRAAAYRAYYEHMPLPVHMRPGDEEMRIYTELDWGGLARFCVLDDRQYRGFQACRKDGARSAPVVDTDECAELSDPARTMLGATQERWLEGSLTASRARWNLLTQQTPMAQFDQKPGPGRRAWTDGWDGYPAARRKLLAFIAERKIANPVVIGGDVHSFNVNELKLNFDDAASPVVASEFVGTSITSQAWAQEKLNEFLPDNPHMKLVDSRYRGYVRVEVTPTQMRTDLRAMETVSKPDAACSTLATFVVENGKAGPQKA